LTYLRNRYYDAATGRFTQEDPIGLAGGLNLYGYANGDPINNSDPFGLRACDPPGSCVVAGAAVGSTMGAVLGTTVAVGCTIVSGGICAAGAPAIIGGSTLLFGTLGTGAGAFAENADDIAAAAASFGDRIRRKVHRAIEGVGFIVGLFNMDVPPKKPQDEDHNPPPAAAPKTTNEPSPNPDT
jgi:uncharacterized protein RhaS with RHS repeats